MNEGMFVSLGGCWDVGWVSESDMRFGGDDFVVSLGIL